jgi:centromere DNA-binding complex CBF3 subunit-like protein
VKLALQPPIGRKGRPSRIEGLARAPSLVFSRSAARAVGIITNLHLSSWGAKLARDVQPPESLRRLVWLYLDRWRAAHLGFPEAAEKVEPNLAAGAFLELLDRLRDVLLQASPLVTLLSLS